MIEMIIYILWIIGIDMAMFLSTEKWGIKCFQLIKTAFLSWIYASIVKRDATPLVPA